MYKRQYVDRVAGELADLALADQAASGDIGIVDQIGEILGASSQTLQESFSTAVRVRRAEARARELLATREQNGYEVAAQPAAAPLQGLPTDDDADAEPTAAEAADAKAAAEAESAAIEKANRIAAEEAKRKAAAEAAAAEKAAAEAQAAAADKSESVAGPWDLDEAAPTADNETDAPFSGEGVSGPWDLGEASEPAAAQSKPSAAAMPRRVRRK